MKITFYGQACFTIETKGKTILTDPFISGNPLAQHINVDDIQADFILLSHGHQDHILDAVSIAKRTGAKVIAPYEVHVWAQSQGIENTHPLNPGGKWQFDFGTVLCTVAIHSSSFPDGSYAGNPVGFVIWNDEMSVYFAGDTALTMDMKLIPMLCPPLDVAILPIGDNFTMDVKGAVIASEFVACPKVIGCHYDTFGFIKIDHDEARNAFEAAGKELILLDIGKPMEV